MAQRGKLGAVGSSQGAPWPFVWFDAEWKRNANGPIMERIASGGRPWIEVVVVALVGLFVLWWILKQAREFMSMFEDESSYMVHEPRGGNQAAGSASDGGDEDESEGSDSLKTKQD